MTPHDNRISRTCPIVGALLAAIALAIAGCSGAAGPPQRVQNTPTPEPVGASTAELEAIYRARVDSARMRFTEADVRFMTGMIGHHAQALVMAGLAPTHGAGFSVRTLTARIINGQRDEIATMQQWLRDRGQPVPEVDINRATMTLVRGPAYVMDMPGMLTSDQLRELDGARASEFDRVFLTLMIQHHRGAVTMVQGLFGTDGAAQGDLMFKLASDIHVDQITEIARMELMLEEMTDADPGD